METKNSLGYTLDLIACTKETKEDPYELLGKQLRKKMKVTITVPFYPDDDPPILSSQEDLP